MHDSQTIGTYNRVFIANQRRRAPSPQIAVLRRYELTDGSTVTDVQLMDPDGNVLATIACLGFTHALDVRDAINRNAAYVEVP